MADSELTPDERAAMRAFLQRCDVRLSTMHRVATALLSGAGILVLLPSVERDTVISVLRALLTGPMTFTRLMLLLAIAVSVGLALTVLWLVVVELTRFYFHSNHVEHDGREVFTPRFTLTGLRLPADELEPATNAAYEAVHASDETVRLLVPSNTRGRARIDRQLDAYPGLVPAGGATDGDRALALFELAASRRRSLVEEVAKVEYGMVRHMLRLQVIVLRYVKALLVVVITAVSAFASAAAINGASGASRADQRWIAASMLLWAPAVMTAVSAPVRWLSNLLRSEGAARTGIGRDRELTLLEDLAFPLAGLAWLAGAIAMVALQSGSITHDGRVASITVLALTFCLLVFSVVRRGLVRHNIGSH